MDISELERLVSIIESRNVGELTLRQGRSRLTIRKRNAPISSRTDGALACVSNQDNDGVPVGAGGDADSDEAELPTDPDAVLVTSPLVGLFRHARPLVGRGARVTAGQVVGVIEAMRLPNEVHSPIEGTVQEVLVEDGMPVEYGQTLFVLHIDAEGNGAE